MWNHPRLYMEQWLQQSLQQRNECNEKNKATVTIKNGGFDTINSAVIISSTGKAAQN